MANDDKVIIGLSHGLDDAESVLISYLMGIGTAQGQAGPALTHQGRSARRHAP